MLECPSLQWWWWRQGDNDEDDCSNIGPHLGRIEINLECWLLPQWTEASIERDVSPQLEEERQTFQDVGKVWSKWKFTCLLWCIYTYIYIIFVSVWVQSRAVDTQNAMLCKIRQFWLNVFDKNCLPIYEESFSRRHLEMLCAKSLTFFTKSDSTYIWSWRRWTSRHHRTTCLLFAWTHTGFHLSAAGILLLPPLFPHKKRRAPYHYHLFFSWLNLWCLLFKERRIIGTSLCARSVLTEPIWDKIKEVIRKFALKKDNL